MASENYSLNNLKEWLEDALESEASPEEVYDCIVHTIHRKVIYHQKCAKDAQEVLNLLSYKRSLPKNVVEFKDVTDDKMEWYKFWHEKGIEFKLDSPFLHNEEE
tara:strand:+ start:183 stop:494 length:312 start_codon:yes stop_codon:yes gene_type:complete